VGVLEPDPGGGRALSPDSASLARELLGIVTASWKSQAVYVAARLGVPDLLANGPRTSEEIAAASGAHAPSLQRLLRALTTIDICRERDVGAFELTPMGSLLRTDAPDSVRSWTIYWGESLWPVWGHLLYSVETGESARTLLQGTRGFEHLEKDPETAAVFHQAMVELTRLISRDVLRAYDFSGLKRIVDVGGGYGELLAAILEKNPGAVGVLFDLPHAIDRGRRRLEAAGLGSRCEFVTGSFFEAVPSGADAYVLKSVLHDWDDERCQTILDRCHRAMDSQGKLLLVERVVPVPLEASAEHQAVARSDLLMLVALAGQERTEAQFRSLLDAAGFRMTRTVPAGSTFCVIEASPVA
jgi:ubiquinone/menaquinone biosynthesis C-methylase UbiE